MSSSDAAPRGWRALPTLAARTVRDSADDRILGLGAEVAFFILLSLAPALLAILGSLGFISNLVGGDLAVTVADQVVGVAGSFLTEETIEDFVRPTVERLLSEGRADVASVGIVLTLWAASRATGRMIEAVSIAYDQVDHRSIWRRRLLAFGLTLGTMLGVVVVIPILIAGPRVLEALTDPLGISQLIATVWRFLYWPVVALLGAGLLAGFYHVAVPIKTAWRRDLPGALLALVLWLLGGLALRVYAYVAISDTTYGPLAAPVVLLLWLFVTALAVLVGAELNAEIEKMWPSGAEEKGEEGDEPPERPAEEEPPEDIAPRGL